SNHHALGVASSDPLDAHLDSFAVALHIHDDPFDNLANDFFAIGIGGGWSSPKHGNIRRQAANRFSLDIRKDAGPVLDKSMVLLLELLLTSQFLFPSAFQCPGHEPMFRFDRLVLTSGPLDFVGGSFAPLLPEPSQLGTLLLHPFGGGERQL